MMNDFEKQIVVREEDLKPDRQEERLVVTHEDTDPKFITLMRGILRKFGLLDDNLEAQIRIGENITRSAIDAGLFRQIIILNSKNPTEALVELDKIGEEIKEAGEALDKIFTEEIPLIPEVEEELEALFRRDRSQGLTENQLSQANAVQQAIGKRDGEKSGGGVAGDDIKGRIIILDQGDDLLAKAIKEHGEARQAQLDFLRKNFAETIFSTPIDMRSHRKQSYTGRNLLGLGSSNYSCAIASVRNAMIALLGNDESEDQIIHDMGGQNNVFGHDGYAVVAKIMPYLESKGLVAQQSESMIDLIACLRFGGVAIIAYGGHAKLISRVDCTNGKMTFRLHDPFNNTEPRDVEDQDLINAINTSHGMSNTFLVMKERIDFG